MTRNVAVFLFSLALPICRAVPFGDSCAWTATQTKHKINRRREIIRIRAEIDENEKRKKESTKPRISYLSKLIKLTNL